MQSFNGCRGSAPGDCNLGLNGFWFNRLSQARKKPICRIYVILYVFHVHIHDLICSTMRILMTNVTNMKSQSLQFLRDMRCGLELAKTPDEYRQQLIEV